MFIFKIKCEHTKLQIDSLCLQPLVLNDTDICVLYIQKMSVHPRSFRSGSQKALLANQKKATMQLQVSQHSVADCWSDGHLVTADPCGLHILPA